jgi:ATP-binding cassette subfamily B multidrug efflux pump
LKSLRRLLPYFRRYPVHLAGGVSCILASVALGLVTPILVGHAVDALRREVQSGVLVRFGLLIVGATALQGLFNFGQRRVLVAMSRHIEFDLRQDFFAHLESQPPTFFHHHYTGDLMARATNDLQAVRMLCGPAIMYSSNTLFTATGALVFMARINVRLTLLALATMPLVALVTNVFGQRIHHWFERVQEQFSSLSTRVQENLAGVRVVRAYAQEAPESGRFRGLNQEYVERNRHLIRWTAAFHPLLQLLVGVGFVAVLWYGGLLVRRESISIGQFVTFNFFLGKLIWPMIAIGWVINLVQRGAASFGRICQVLDEEPTVRDVPPLRPLHDVRGAIGIRHLTFAWNTDEPVLHDLDVEVQAGTTVALVGRTGSGKSTLLSLLPRLAEPPRGTVFLDGVDVRELALSDLRGAMAVVPQESFLFSISVADNIAVGRPDAERTAVERAASLAGLDMDLESFPRGLDTLVGERGITLSGGQKQRVTLARALLRDAPILILDDCLSAVDTQTEEHILENLKRVFPGRTVFMVSHRISTVRHADLILVLEAGSIVDRGTHEELLARPGLYADLELRQRLEDELAAV